MYNTATVDIPEIRDFGIVSVGFFISLTKQVHCYKCLSLFNLNISL